MRASSPSTPTSTRSLLEKSVVVTAATRPRSAAMSASSLSYATGGGLGAPCGNSFGSGVSGERFCAAASVPGLGGGAPKSSPDVTDEDEPPAVGAPSGEAAGASGFAGSGLAVSAGAADVAGFGAAAFGFHLPLLCAAALDESPSAPTIISQPATLRARMTTWDAITPAEREKARQAARPARFRDSTRTSTHRCGASQDQALIWFATAAAAFA